MDNLKQKPRAVVGIGCYMVLSYLLYWPAFWGMRLGIEWHASRHWGFTYEIGEPSFWAFMWFFAPVTIPFLLLANLIYWVLSPMLDFIGRVFW